MQRARIRLETQKDVVDFVNIAETIEDEVYPLMQEDLLL